MMRTKETGVMEKAWKKGMHKLCVVYPNLYYGGVYCLGPLLVYNLANTQKNWLCDRAYLDSMQPLREYEMVGFTFQYELDIHHILKIVKEQGVQKENEERPLTFAGGPCVTNNPDILKDVVDFLFIGDCEDSLPRVLELYEKGMERETFLDALADIRGVYVPGRTRGITSAVVNLDEAPYPLYQPLPENIDKRFVFGDAFLLEVERGCPFRCTFCNIPGLYAGFRYRSLEYLKKIVDAGLVVTQRRKVVIYAPTFAHPDRKALLRYLLSKGVTFSIPSLRPEYVDLEELQLIRKGGQKSLTFAPEAGETLRLQLNKRCKDETFFAAFRSAHEAGFTKIKLYFLVGLPGQTEDDLREAVAFVAAAKKEFGGSISVSVNVLVPKNLTALEKEPFRRKEARQQIDYFKGHMNCPMKVDNLSVALQGWEIAHRGL